MYILKQLPEDFIVREVTDLKPQDKGRFLYFKVKKKNRNTMDVIKQLAKFLNLKTKDIGFAGSKDKHALTEQYISVLSNHKNKILRATIENVELEFFGCGNEPLTLGDLQGNSFEIVVRNLEDTTLKPADYCENYFDEQRFSQNNKDIGKHLVKKQFKEALRLIDNPECQEVLTENSHDYIGALKKIPPRLLRMYVNAYQSYLWNEILARYLREKKQVLKIVNYSLGEYIFAENKTDLTIPLLGFDEDLISAELQDIVEKLLEEENLDFSDFIIKQIPELSMEGELRPAYLEIKDLALSEMMDDELNPGKKKILIKFFLPKGSYATMVMRRLLA